MKILLIGGSGKLGYELRRSLAMHQCTVPSRREMDLMQLDLLGDFFTVNQYDVVINAAGITDVDACESMDKNDLITVNALAPIRLAELCRRNKAIFIHISTDYVFDGKSPVCVYSEDDATLPLNQYGISKKHAELGIKEIGGMYYIFRTSFLYGNIGNNFLNKLRGWAAAGGPVRCPVDHIGNPTWTRHLAESIGRAAWMLHAWRVNASSGFYSFKEYPTPGVYHLAGDGQASRFQFAQAALKDYAVAVEPAHLRDFERAADVPFAVSLSGEKFVRTFGFYLPFWLQSLRQCVEDWMVTR